MLLYKNFSLDEKPRSKLIEKSKTNTKEIFLFAHLICIYDRERERVWFGFMAYQPL